MKENKKFDQAIKGMIKNLQVISRELPKQIEEAKKNLSEDDAQKIKQAMKQSDFTARTKEFNDVTKDFEKFLKTL